MLLLLEVGWPWMGVGALLLIWGLHDLGMSWRHWIRVIFAIVYIPVQDETSSEKQSRESMTVHEEVTANPGCALILLALVAFIYGLTRFID
jgi:hypothetical protein